MNDIPSSSYKKIYSNAFAERNPKAHLQSEAQPVTAKSVATGANLRFAVNCKSSYGHCQEP